ncbi:MAG: 16S rRNA (guanine(966)-N(2))-methyltransferase RsmD [Firmicutes bacterium]|nr:16S rRNA (guanine(966)-N(2))-methyltransferase RsmD [Bacillota bacterium]
MIAGSAKGRRLKSVLGKGTRPALARVRAAVFNIAQSAVPDSRFLDLFAGTGAYGIEALSRGATSATFVDLDPRAVSVIRHNLRLCGLEGRAHVINADVLRAVDRLRKQGMCFDIIVVAPPYFRGLGPKTMERIAGLGLLEPGGLCFVQHHEGEYMEPAFSDLSVVRRYSYGSNMLSLYRRGSPA